MDVQLVGIGVKYTMNLEATDQKTFQALAQPLSNRLFRALFLMVRNEQDALDLLQDTFVRAYEHFHRYDYQQPFYPWILTIGKNLARNHFRKKETAVNSLPENWDGPSNYLGPEEGLLRAEQSRQIFHALHQMKPEQRAILELKHFQDCSYQEISSILDIPLGTVMSRLYYARKELSALLEKER